MALTRIDSYLVDLDSLGGITFDDQAGVPTFKVDAVSHRVGIGTATPQRKLDVRGDLNLSGYIYNVGDTDYYFKPSSFWSIKGGGYITESATTNGYIQIGEKYVFGFDVTTGGKFEIKTNGSSFFNGGNVGIGTTNPSSKLHVYNGDLELTGGYNLTWGGTFSGGNPAIWGNASNKTIRFAPDGNTTGLVALLGVSSSYILGNVGIGTTNPGTKLDIYGDIAINGTFAIRRKDYGYSATYKNVLIGSPDSVANTVSLCVDVSTISGGNFHGQNQVIIPRQGLLVPNNAGTNFIGVLSRDSNDYIRIGPDAPGGISGGPITVTTSNVGIGTTNPTQKLHVVGLTTLGGILNSVVTISNDGTYTSGSGAGTRLDLLYGGLTIARISNTGSGVRDGWFSLFDEGTSTVNIAANASRGGNTYFNNGGNVGIGTTNPQKSLEAIVSASDYVSIGVSTLNISQWSGIHFGYRENNNAYRKSVLAFERIDGAARGKIHILNNNDNNSNNATLSDSRLTIQSDGNVGIGTTNPSTKLHVSGGKLLVVESGTPTGTYNYPVNIHVNSGTSGIQFTSGTDYSYIGGNSSDIFLASNNGATGIKVKVSRVCPDNSMVINSSGNIGIGTTNPSYKFEISESQYSRLTLLQSTTGRRWQLGNDGSNLYVYNELNAVRAFDITPTGNVGIGLANASTRLEAFLTVQGQNAERYTPVDVLSIGADNESSSVYGGFGQGLTFRGRSYNVSTYRTLGRILHRIWDDSINTTLGSSLEFQTSNNGSIAAEPTTKLIINNAGNVGVGMTNPDTKLDVNGLITARAGLTIKGASIPVGGSALHLEGSPGSPIAGRIIVGDATGWKTYISSKSSGGVYTDLVTFQDTGNVGIGATNPPQKLYVNGNVQSTGRFIFGGSAEGGARSLAAGSGATVIDTGITINATNGGGTMLVLACRNTSNGTATQSAVYMLQFYYDGDNTPTKTLISGSDIMAINKSATNTLTVTCGTGNWAVTAFVCGFNIT